MYLFLLLEFQSSVDARMPPRFLRYIASFYEASLDQHPDAERLPAVFPVLLYDGDAQWTVPVGVEAMIEHSLPERFLPRLSYYPVIINAIPKARLERIHNAVSAVFFVENSDPEELENLVESGDTSGAQVDLDALLRQCCDELGDDFFARQRR